MTLTSGHTTIARQGNGLVIRFDGADFVEGLGIGTPIQGAWRWTLDGSLKLLEDRQGQGRDGLGPYSHLTLAFSVPGVFPEDVPVFQQSAKAYDSSRLLVETWVLEEVRGTFLEDSFYSTTFNSPVLLPRDDLSYLAYTWGLMGQEASRDGGHFPEAVTGRGVSTIPSKLLGAGYSPREDLHTTNRKPFCPLVLYDDQERTLVVSPFDHFLVSPLRVIETPEGAGIARGVHGSVDVLPRGTTTRTALVFGHGVAETMATWGRWLLETGGKEIDLHRDHPLLSTLGFWNCFGGYYTELFRRMDEKTLLELASYFKRDRIPVRYFGLDLWYDYGHVGFARSYTPDKEKYPRGLSPVHRETGLPFFLDTSAFESPNDYIGGDHEFTVDRLSSYPTRGEFYRDLAGEFQGHGAFGIWPDFLRTQVQNSSSLRSTIGAADRWFDGMAQAYGDQDMAIMLCMPTMGHYLASTRHPNVVAVRTHTDYLNHQAGQVEALQESGAVRVFLPPQSSIRHNVMLSLVAHSLGLYPSFDVFLTNASHPEGFAEPNAREEALLRAMSAGVLAVGDKAGHIDRDIINKLCFPDGRTSRPDHPALPLVSTFQSEVLATCTATTLGDLRWVYLGLFNVAGRPAHYRLDLEEVGAGPDALVYDYFASTAFQGSHVEGDLDPARAHYYVIMPQYEGIHLLGFPEKFITVSRYQVTGVETWAGGATVKLSLPETGDGYTWALWSAVPVEAAAEGADLDRVSTRGGLTLVEFTPRTGDPTLTFRRRDAGGPP